MLRLSTLLLSALLLAGCTGEDALPTGRWRAVATVPGGPLPFGLDLEQTEDGYSAALLNGGERVPVREVEVTPDSVHLNLPAFNSRIAAARVDATLEGTLSLVKGEGDVERLPFRATHGAPHRFAPSGAGPAADVDGRWEVTFTGGDGTSSNAVGTFTQDGDRVTGTFMTPTADHRFLEGTVRGDSLFLSTFDGSHAFLYEAEIQPDGTLDGDFWSGTRSHNTWTAERDSTAALPDPYQLTYLKDGYDTFDFAFPSAQDSSVVRLSDPRFDDKVVLVTIAGSWCPNCHDEARFLEQIYPRYRDQGLEIVSLMFERYADFDKAARQVRRYREKFDISYPTLIAGTSDKDAASDALPMLNRVLSYPTAIFVGRDGRVRYIHTGFYGPGTGARYEALKQEFTDRIEGLLAESPSSSS
ncbi:MAG: TlpA disulfide reductase family protein [Salinivenus sp.]